MSNTTTYPETVAVPETEPQNKATKEFMREANANELLNIHTSCDACSARSTNVVFPEGSIDASLSLCGHHTRKNAPALIERGFTVFPDDYSFR